MFGVSLAKRIAKRIIQMGRVGRLDAIGYITDGGGICLGFGWGRGCFFLGFRRRVFMLVVELVVGLFVIVLHVVHEPGYPVLLVHFVSSRG